MEINDQPTKGPRPVSRVGNQPPIDFTRPMRDGIEKFRQTFEPKVIDTTAGSRPQARDADRIEVSAEALKLAAQEAEQTEVSEQRKARLDELRAQVLEGRLNTPERVDRAAERMLGAE